MSFYLSLFFLVAGTGLNLIHYDCAECAHKGIAHIIEEMDESSHHDCHCGCEEHHGMCCTFSHLSVDHSILSHGIEIVVSELTILNGIIPNTLHSFTSVLFSAVDFYLIDTAPPLMLVKLSTLHCTFLI